jgi:hypothetical protein
MTQKRCNAMPPIKRDVWEKRTQPVPSIDRLEPIRSTSGKNEPNEWPINLSDC